MSGPRKPEELAENAEESSQTVEEKKRSRRSLTLTKKELRSVNRRSLPSTGQLIEEINAKFKAKQRAENSQPSMQTAPTEPTSTRTDTSSRRDIISKFATLFTKAGSLNKKQNLPATFGWDIEAITKNYATQVNEIVQHHLTLSPDGKMMAFVLGTVVTDITNPVYKSVVVVKDNKQQIMDNMDIKFEEGGLIPYYNCLVFGGNHKYIVGCRGNGSLDVWEIASKKHKKNYPGIFPSDMSWHCMLAINQGEYAGKILLATGKELQIFEPASGKILKTLDTGIPEAISKKQALSHLYDINGKIIAISTEAGISGKKLSMTVFDVHNLDSPSAKHHQNFYTTLSGDRAEDNIVAGANNDFYLFSGQKIYHYDLATGLLKQFAFFNRDVAINAFAISPTGEHIAVSGSQSDGVLLYTVKEQPVDTQNVLQLKSQASFEAPFVKEMFTRQINGRSHLIVMSEKTIMTIDTNSLQPALTPKQSLGKK